MIMMFLFLYGTHAHKVSVQKKKKSQYDTIVSERANLLSFKQEEAFMFHKQKDYQSHHQSHQLSVQPRYSRQLQIYHQEEKASTLKRTRLIARADMGTETKERRVKEFMMRGEFLDKKARHTKKERKHFDGMEPRLVLILRDT
jgi:hypothetical protein